MNTTSPDSPVFSENDGEEVHDEDHLGDYSTRFEELMSDEDEQSRHANGNEGDEGDDEAFFYSGADAEPSGTYRDQLRDVLGLEHEEDSVSEQEVERSIMHEVSEKEQFETAMDDEARPADASPDLSVTASSPSRSEFLSPPKVVVSTAPDDGLKNKRPFLHPTISRLRSITPQASRTPSVGSFASTDLQLGIATPASHFSALSPTSSQSNLPTVSHTQRDEEVSEEREVFRWSQLRNISDLVYQSHKASSVLGVPNVGSPTALAANGLICIGTDTGRILVFDFKQNLKCICGSTDKAVGTVTALALSFDHTYVASGHASGHIQLFDVNNPKAPARFVPPTAPADIVAGTREGHLPGSRIVNLGFVAGRHTAIVSADDSGLAFYHSLGKVLFVDASDTLRILGKYPEEFAEPGVGVGSVAHPFRRRKLRKTYSILSMAPLPLGTTSHPTDAYNLVALLTPVKLVVVGLKPSPKTWYRRHREVDDEGSSKSRFKGVLAWFPSVAHGSQTNGKGTASGTMPMLVYGWGNTLNLLRVTESKVTQDLKNPKNGKTSRVEVGRIMFEENNAWNIGGDALALQWLNSNQIIILTSTTLEVYDINTFKLVEHVLFDAWSLVSPVLSHTTNGSMSYSDAVTEVAHSVRVYKGKIFLLGQHEVRVGTLLTWADRILSLVEEGNFLSAIELTRTYYTGEAPGNRNGLPDSPTELRKVVGEKMRGLMVASAEYAFSEDRMTDSTHVTSDGRGVDRTSLFEELVVTCCRACIALGDFDFLFEDLYSFYDNYGIHRIFLTQLEPFVLDGKIHLVPPRITQRLIAMHAEDYRPDLAERIIWHIDPGCLDINQAILLCQQYKLYDALIYVYTRALKDYVSPIVELLELIRQVQRYRRLRIETSPTSRAPLSEAQIESIAINAYKIYPYLGNVLTGVTYPSGDPLPDDDAVQAKNDVYTFLFYGRSSVWPLGEGGRLILTCDDENGVEPTYPYARLLLRFDAEAFLHILDLAFEDHYLNDDPPRGISRLVIVKILLEILATPGIPRLDAMFINIFIARNVPKYPQFIQMEPSILHGILYSLAEDSDEGTREDRQLAAEYLLSTYTPREGDHIIQLFERAGFYRILRSWHRHERHWAPLLSAYIQDQSIRAPEMFTSLDEVLSAATRSSKGKLPEDVLTTITDSLPTLLDISISDTAALLDKRTPDLHTNVMSILADRPPRDRFVYLRSLIGAPRLLDESDHLPPVTRTTPSPNVPPALRMEYIDLLCELTPDTVIDELRYLPEDFVDTNEACWVFEDKELYDAVIWSLNRSGEPQTALEKTESFITSIADQLAESLKGGTPEEAATQLSALEKLQKVAVTICLERTKTASSRDVPLEDIWFKLLRSQINCVYRVASSCPADTAEESEPLRILSSLRSLVHDTFNALLSVSSSKTVSFPGLFKRLVDSKDTRISKGAQYTEFRAILTGMLDAYRSEGDMLVQTKHLMARDLFVSIEELSRARARGWRPSRGLCTSCGEVLHDIKGKGKAVADVEHEGSKTVPIIVSRTGAIYHRHCFPEDHSNITAS